MGMSPALQVALDDPSRSDFDLLAESLLSVGVDRIELGTPLITTLGTSAVRTLARRVPLKQIYADLKCIDLVEHQLRPYLDIGVVHIAVHLCLELAQVERLVPLLQQYQATAYVSTLGFPNADLVLRMQLFRSAGLCHFIFHGEGWTTADAFGRALSKHQTAGELKGIQKTIAGGITLTNCSKLPLSEFAGIIVGRGILDTPDPVRTAQDFASLVHHGSSS